MLHYFWSLLFLVLTSFAFAENYPYELKGSYKLDSSNQKPVEYSLQWHEGRDGDIEGLYKDNYFTPSARARGEVSELGRSFYIELPGTVKGVSSLVLLTSKFGSNNAGTSQSVSVITRDTKGNPLTTAKAKSQFNWRESMVAQKQEENCIEGFGLLAGYCGLYAGMIAEESDLRNSCNLLFADAARLELTTDSTLVLHLGEPNELVEPASHNIGRLPANPQKDSIDVLSRVCGPMVGVKSDSTHCKVLHLTGRFFVQRGAKHFTGTYTISEEGSNKSCRYGLSMDKQFAQ